MYQNVNDFTLFQIVNAKSALDYKGQFSVDVSDDIWKTTFDGAIDRTSREQLSIAMLVAIAFNHLMMNELRTNEMQIWFVKIIFYDNWSLNLS